LFHLHALWISTSLALFDVLGKIEAYAFSIATSYVRRFAESASLFLLCFCCTKPIHLLDYTPKLVVYRQDTAFEI
jgi:hypothetical protein